MVGAGGYGCQYLENVFADHPEGMELVGVVEPFPGRLPECLEKVGGNVPVFATLEEFFEQGEKADLAIISTPISLHKEQCGKLLEHGVHVMCEKPIVSVLQDLADMREMVEKAKENGLTFSVGFQWDYHPAFLKLKEMMLAGELGKPLRMKVNVSWPRNDKYYSRGWAAKLYDKDGNYILDSIVTNGCAHHIQIMLFLLGKSMEQAAEVTDMKGALYRANPIETYDTAVFNAKADCGTDIFMYVTHAGSFYSEPAFIFEYEKATVAYRAYHYDENLYIHFKDGRDVNLGDINQRFCMLNKVERCCEAVRTGISPECGLDAVESSIRVANGLLDHVEITPFAKVVRDDVEGRYFVPGLTLEMLASFDAWKMPSEMGFDWAVPETEFSLEGYDHFQGKLIPKFEDK